LALLLRGDLLEPGGVGDAHVLDVALFAAGPGELALGGQLAVLLVDPHGDGAAGALLVAVDVDHDAVEGVVTGLLVPVRRRGGGEGEPRPQDEPQRQQAACRRHGYLRVTVLAGRSKVQHPRRRQVPASYATIEGPRRGAAPGRTGGGRVVAVPV